MRAADVNDLVIGSIALERCQDSGDSIRHKGKTASLQSITVYRDRLAVEDLIDEDRLRSAPPTQVLPWTIRPEDAQNRNGNAAAFIEAHGQVLIKKFRSGIGPACNRRRSQHAFTGLAERHSRISAVNIGRGCKDKLRFSLRCKLQHIERSFGIYLQRLQPVAVARNLERGEVSKNFNTFA